MEKEELEKLQERILDFYDSSIQNTGEPSQFWTGARSIIDFILGDDEDPTQP